MRRGHGYTDGLGYCVELPEHNLHLHMGCCPPQCSLSRRFAVVPYDAAYQVDDLGVLNTRAKFVVGVETENVGEEGDGMFPRCALPHLPTCYVLLNGSHAVNSRQGL